MKRIVMIISSLLALTATAEDLTGVNSLVCSPAQAQICFETGVCYAATPWELSVPDFVVIDLKKNLISTTKASNLKRSTTFSKIENTEGVLSFQGFENGRAFSFVVHLPTGRMTVAIAEDGFSVSVFGACADKRL